LLAQIAGIGRHRGRRTCLFGEAAARGHPAARAEPARGIALLLRQGDRYETVTLDYHGGFRYPRL
jgi:hypothetical protein